MKDWRTHTCIDYIYTNSASPHAVRSVTVRTAHKSRSAFLVILTGNYALWTNQGYQNWTDTRYNAEHWFCIYPKLAKHGLLTGNLHMDGKNLIQSLHICMHTSRMKDNHKAFDSVNTIIITNYKKFHDNHFGQIIILSFI